LAQRSIRRLLLIVPVALLALLVTTAAIAWLAFDPNAAKDRIESAVEHQTGRRLTLAGNLRLTFLPSPALTAEDVALANLQGGSRPIMVSAHRVTAELAWLPLLQRRVVITRLILEKPDLLIERDAAGTPNWQLAQVLPTTGHPASLEPKAPASERQEVVIQGLRLVDGTVTWHGARDVSLAIARADLAETGPDAPISLAAAATYQATPFEISGRLGSLARLRDSAATDKWPVKLSARTEQASFELEGSLTEPHRLKGYDITIRAGAADLALLRPLVPVALPDLRDLRVSAHLEDASPLPQISELLVHAGASDLTPVLPGVTLTALNIAAPGPEQPIRASAAGHYGGSKLLLDFSGGAPAAWLQGGPDEKFPVDLSAELVGATLKLHGALAHPRTLSGLQASLSAAIPDLAAFAPLARRPLPALHDISLATTVTDREDLLHGIGLADLHLSLPQTDFSGTASLDFGDRPVLAGNFSGKRVDIDALRTAWPAAPPPANPIPAKPGPSPAPGPYVIPDTPFALGAIRRADADLRFDLGEILWRGVAYRAVAGHLTLNDGHLVLDPAAATLPAGPATGRLEIDAGKTPAQVALVLHSPGLAVKPLLTELQLPDDFSGVLQVDADLHGAGDSPHQVAATADGYLGLSMVNGVVDGKLVSQLFGGLLRSVRLPFENPGTGRSELRCFAVRLDADHGIAAVRAFYLSVSRLRVAGSGSVDLGRETLSLRLRPFVEVAGTGLVVPIRVGGTFRKPTSSINPAGTPDAIAAEAEILAKEGSNLTPITSAIAAAGEKILGEADTGNCGPALDAARNGQPGPDPAPLKPEKKQGAEDFLKRLFK